MKLRVKIGFVLDSFIRHLKSNIMMVVFVVMTIFVITRCMVVYNSTTYNTKKLDELYNGRLEDLYIIRVKKPDVNMYDFLKRYKSKEELKLFRSAVGNLSGVRGFDLIVTSKAVPYIVENNTREARHWWAQFVKKTSGNNMTIGKGTQSSYAQYDNLVINRNNLGLCDLKLADGRVIDETYIDSIDKKYDKIFFVGSKLKELDMGVELIDEAGGYISLSDIQNEYENHKEFYDNGYYGDYDESKEQYWRQEKIYVAGVLAPGSQWIDAKNTYGNAGDSSTFIPLDYALVEVNTYNNDSGYEEGDYYLSVSENADVEGIIASIKDLATEYNIKIEYSSVADNRLAVDRKQKRIVSLLAKTSVIAIILTTVLMCVIQIIMAINDRNVHGILYANGARKKDILVMNLMENIIRVVIGAVIGFMLEYNEYYKPVATQQMQIKYEDVHRYSLPAVIVAVVCVIVFSSIIPYMITKKTSPARLVEGGLR